MADWLLVFTVIFGHLSTSSSQSQTESRVIICWQTMRDEMSACKNLSGIKKENNTGL